MQEHMHVRNKVGDTYANLKATLFFICLALILYYDVSKNIVSS